uniref:Uncharacterized protein n=1 Tax=Euplotes harpa TaxID=151035 RepID=A0A7S3N6J0_9SPIT|mmetsp:Transcript_26941/g.31104  ORF Transcript_26941/g.31104 Transcript_26941/m.31104 type:complete len:103 (+) Transcript_26941:293-601(+)
MLHNNIKVESVEGKWTKFTFTIEDIFQAIDENREEVKGNQIVGPSDRLLQRSRFTGENSVLSLLNSELLKERPADLSCEFDLIEAELRNTIKDYSFFPMDPV